MTADQYNHDEDCVDGEDLDYLEDDEFSSFLSNWRNQSKRNDKDDEAASFLSN